MIHFSHTRHRVACMNTEKRFRRSRQKKKKKGAEENKKEEKLRNKQKLSSHTVALVGGKRLTIIVPYKSSSPKLRVYRISTIYDRMSLCDLGTRLAIPTGIATWERDFVGGAIKQQPCQWQWVRFYSSVSAHC